MTKTEPQKHLRKEFASHLKTEGFKLSATHNYLERRIKKLMGAERHEAYLETALMYADDVVGVDALYQTVRSQEEAHLLFSQQAEVILESGVWLATKLAELDPVPKRIADLGCATGAMTRWLASVFATARVVGFDREKSLLGIATGIPGKTQFLRWDYGQEETVPEDGFDAFVSALGIDWNQAVSVHIPLGCNEYRALDTCKQVREMAQPIFTNWRSIAKNGAKLFAVLRIPDLWTLVGVVDAASDAGWSLELDCFLQLQVNADEQIPGLTFTAKVSERPDENVLAGVWITDAFCMSPEKPLMHEAARSVYRFLGPKEVIGSRELQFDDGHTAWCTIAKCGPWALHFTEATTGYARLEFHPSHKACQLDLSICFLPSTGTEGHAHGR